jgi:tetratricopeptide (TPR) repeat protein
MKKNQTILILLIVIVTISSVTGLGLWLRSSKPVPVEATPGWEQLTASSVLALKAGKAKEAEEFCTRAMKMLGETGTEDLRLVKTYMLMGEIYRWENKFNLAEQSFKKSVIICEKSIGKDHPDMIIPIESLANFYYYTLIDYDKVASLYERIFNIIGKISGSDNNQLAIRARNLADVYSLLGRYAQAEPLYKQALALTEKAMVPNESDLVQYLLSLADLYQKWGKCNLAELSAKRALAIREMKQKESSGPDSQLDIVVCLDALGKIYLGCNRSKESELSYSRSLKIIEKIWGINSPDLATRLTGLASALRNQHKYVQAEAHYIRSLSILEKGLGYNSSEIIPVLEQYAELMKLINKPKEAKTLLSRTDSIRAFNNN